MRVSFVIAGLAVLLVGVFLTTMFLWSMAAASSNEGRVDWQALLPTGGIAAVGVGLMIAGMKLKDK
jgi:hypothetical protein